jgi:hypothetical protein
VLERIREDLHPHALDFVGAEERGIWITPEGQAFVDGEFVQVSALTSSALDEEGCTREQE